MRVTNLSLAWVFLAWVPPPAGATGASRTDSWVILPDGIPPLRYPQIAADSARNLYFQDHPGIFLLEAGSLRPLPLPELPGYHPGPFLSLNPAEYWVAMLRSDAKGDAARFLYHRRSGGWTRYDSATAPCSQGFPLGLDAAGNPVLELRTSNFFSTTTQGVFRLVDGRCREIPLGVRKNSEMSATRYFRDSRGREYFALNRISDVPGCGGFARLGDTLERFETVVLEKDPLGVVDPRVPLCVEDFEESGDTVFLASHPGLGILVDTTITHIREFRGIAAIGITGVLRDSRGYLWVGTEGYDFHPPPLGLVQIKGPDTTLIHKHNSGLPTLFPRSLWEDKAGNLWVQTAEGAIAVLVREGNPQPLGLAPSMRRPPPRLPEGRLRTRDILGRRHGPPLRPARGLPPQDAW